MNVVPIFVQAVLYSVTVNILLIVFNMLVIGLNATQTASFNVLVTGLSFTFLILFHRFNRYIRMFLVSAAISVVLPLTMRVLYSVIIEFQQIFTVLLIACVISIVITAIIVPNDEQAGEITE